MWKDWRYAALEAESYTATDCSLERKDSMWRERQELKLLEVGQRMYRGKDVFVCLSLFDWVCIFLRHPPTHTHTHTRTHIYLCEQASSTAYIQYSESCEWFPRMARSVHTQQIIPEQVNVQ